MNAQSSFHLNSLEDLPKAAEWIWMHVSESRHLAFEGDMGAGKTTIIQALCKYLGVETEVTSPTFALVNEYQGHENQTFFHFDFYRINDPVEALDFGFEEYLSSDGICLMEWSEKVEVLLPPEVRYIHIDVLDDGSRLLRLV